MTLLTEEGSTPPPGASAFTPARWRRLTRRPSEPVALLDAFLLALNHISDGVLVADMRLRGQPIVQVNPAFEAITGYAASEAIGKNCRYLQGCDRQQPEITEVRAALTEGRECSVTLRNYRRDGTMFRNALRLLPFRDGTGQVTHFIGLICDVTHAPGIDRLTGLLDRYGLLDRLAAIDGPSSTAVLLVKLDILRFHDVNNGFGYDVGDALLRSVAARLATLPAAAVARVGTNSFTLAFTFDDAGRVTSVVDDVLALLRPASSCLARRSRCSSAPVLPSSASARTRSSWFGRPARRCNDPRRCPGIHRIPMRRPTNAMRATASGWRAICSPP